MGNVAGVPLKALVVDDDRAILDLVSRVLEREGFQVDRAIDGEQALERISNSSYQLILLDLMMPKMDGVQVLERIRRVNSQSLRKIIVTSAAAELHLGRLQGVCHVLPKPFDITSLANHARDCALPADLGPPPKQVNYQ